MKNIKLHLSAVFTVFLIIGLTSTGAQAQGDANAAATAAMKKDSTGTNPINFTHDLRIFHEYQFLNTPGDGDQQITTTEFRLPFSDGKWQFRMRGRGQQLNLDTNNDGIDEVSEGGTGDFDFRILTVPIVDMKNKFALAAGFETFLPTASEDELGSGVLSFGPQLFAVFFAPFGIKGTLFAPAYQHKFSIAEDDGRDEVHQSLIDLFFLWISPTRQYWALFNPQIILDYEKSEQFSLVDLEMGTMLDKIIGLKGHSVYLRPSFSIGADRPTDASIEVGYKIIWH
jgi:hypothetical protein